MSRWKVKSSTLVILSCLAFLMVLILVLPDVDLPDTAFHRGTSPVSVNSQATAPPAAITIAAVRQLPDTVEAYRPQYQAGDLAADPDPNSRPILLRSIRR
jgi:hypothetical protein